FTGPAADWAGGCSVAGVGWRGQVGRDVADAMVRGLGARCARNSSAPAGAEVLDGALTMGWARGGPLARRLAPPLATAVRPFGAGGWLLMVADDGEGVLEGLGVRDARGFFRRCGGGAQD